MRTCLVVDDSSVIRKVARRILEGLDCQIIEAEDGEKALEHCKRQLPDAVVVLFFPNEQNLVGLREVCRRIRKERTSGLEKFIRLHFVMSNVPDLDDEDRVLRDRRVGSCKIARR